VKNGIPQLSVKDLKRRIDAGEDVYILDVREPYEYRIAQIGGKLIPQTDVPNRLAEDRPRPRDHRANAARASVRSASQSFSSSKAIRGSSTLPEGF